MKMRAMTTTGVAAVLAAGLALQALGAVFPSIPAHIAAAVANPARPAAEPAFDVAAPPRLRIDPVEKVLFNNIMDLRATEFGAAGYGPCGQATVRRDVDLDSCVSDYLGYEHDKGVIDE